MNKAFKGALVATALIAGSATSAFAQRAGGDGDQPAPHCCTTTPPHHPHHPTVNNGGNANAASNSSASNNTRVNVLVAPNMAMSSGWCQDNLTGVIGVGVAGGMGTLGLGKSEFKQLCGQWYAIANGAGNPSCVPSTTSVLMAGGYTAGPALREAVLACSGTLKRKPQFN